MTTNKPNVKEPDVSALVEALETCLQIEERPEIIKLARAALTAYHNQKDNNQ